MSRPPLVEAISISNEMASTYGRQMLVPGIGREGQGRLANARVLLIGCGGLGSPVALYLAGAGIGTIGLVDDDIVSPSNLHRQVAHTYTTVGQLKTASAKAAILARNPNAVVHEHSVRLDSANVLDLFGAYDLIVDGSDNLATRYVVSDAAEILGKPVVYGSVIRMEGQVSVFWAGHGPTYRDVVPNVPAPGAVPACTDAGVVGPVCAQVGSVMATEAIKLITGVGESLLGRLMIIDAAQANVFTIKVPVNPDRPPVTKVEDLAMTSASPSESSIPSLTATDLQERLQSANPPVVLDVRGLDEREICVIDGSVSIPLNELADRLDELDKDAAIITQCKGGIRSQQAAQILIDAGFTNITNLDGGILAWADQVDPDMATY